VDNSECGSILDQLDPECGAMADGLIVEIILRRVQARCITFTGIARQ
jgi:hypothetical protein